jgi:putative endonuclease
VQRDVQQVGGIVQSTHLSHKRDIGARAYLSGCAAEEAVARTYADQDYDLMEVRWRGQSGEIDLVFRKNDVFVFVEVKKARSFDAAAQRLGRAQAKRIHGAAAEYVAQAPMGQLTDMRFDLALCNQSGEIEIREGAFSHF